MKKPNTNTDGGLNINSLKLRNLDQNIVSIPTILDTPIPYYPGNIYISKPIGMVPVGTVLNAIKNPKPEYVALINKIRSAPNEEVKGKLKEQLVSVTPATVPKFNGKRRFTDIGHFTGILPLDFDKLPSREFSEEFKTKIFNSYPFIFAGWLSSSGKGCRFLVQIPRVQSVERYKDYYRGIFALIGHEKGFDVMMQNPVLPMYYSIDENALIRDNPTTFNNPIKDTKPPPRPIVFKEYSVSKSKAVYTIVANRIEPITDNGHPQLRATAYLVGGYVGAGLITQQEAIDLLFIHIERNAYLSQKAYTYKRTAKYMILEGQNEPIGLD